MNQTGLRRSSTILGAVVGGAGFAGLLAALPIQAALAILAGIAIPLLVASVWSTSITQSITAGMRAPGFVYLVLLISCALVALDLPVYGGQQSPYLLTAACALAIILKSGRTESSFPSFRDAVLLIFVGLGLVGSLIGRIFDAQEANALALFVPLTLVVIVLANASGLYIDELRAKNLTRWLLLIGLAYSLISFTLWVGGLDFLPPNDFKHSRIFLSCMALSAAVALKWWRTLMVLMVLVGGTFLSYPALTVVLALALTIGLLVFERYRRTAVVFLPALIAGMSLVSINISELRSDYFEGVGKIDNTPARAALLQSGIDRFWDSPIIGSFFRDNLYVESSLTGTITQVPVHNDYVQVAMGGGIIGLSIFVTWCVASLGYAIRCCTLSRRRKRPFGLALSTTLTVGLSTLFLSAFFNPVLIDTRNSLILTTFSIMLTMLYRSLSRDDAASYEPAIRSEALVA